jgi:hypothetical protein
MNSLKILGEGLLRILKPTGTQSVVAFVLAGAILATGQSRQVFSILGISDGAIELTRQQLTQRFSVLLDSPLAGGIALVTFWAAVGLVAYLACWGAYNAIVEARNEVTIEIQYTNKGHWQGVIETLALKAVAACGLVVYLAVFRYGLALWLTLSSGVLAQPGLAQVLIAVIAVFGMALQLYCLLILLQLTLTPWYRLSAFTDAEK